MKGEPPVQAWIDVINTNLVGTINAIQVALPHLKEGASIIATGSTAALMDTARRTTPATTRRHGVRALQARAVGLRPRPRYRAGAPRHPRQRRPSDQLQHRHAAAANRCTGRSGQTWRTPTRADAEPVFDVQQAMKVPWVEPEDISNVMLWLASDEARFVTGAQLRIDGGGYLKWYDYHI